jgi:molecular chaperone GrpE (heat shock protein)
MTDDAGLGTEPASSVESVLLTPKSDLPLLPDDAGLAIGPEPSYPVGIEELAHEISGLREQLAKDHARAEARERTIDRLHAEVERLRAGEARTLLRPVITDLRRLRHDLLAQARSLVRANPGADSAALLESFADTVEFALERCGVSVIHPAQGDLCEPAVHQVTGIASTGDHSLDGKVSEIVSDGYLEVASSHLIAPARVIVYQAVRENEGDPALGQRPAETFP